MDNAFAGKIRCLIYNHYMSMLCGNQVPYQRRVYERITNPQIGDLVIEATTLYMPSRSNLDGLGYLRQIEMEPITVSYPNFEWDEEAEGKPCPTEKVYYVETFDGRLFRWYNALIIAGLTEHFK